MRLFTLVLFGLFSVVIYAQSTIFCSSSPEKPEKCTGFFIQEDVYYSAEDSAVFSGEIFYLDSNEIYLVITEELIEKGQFRDANKVTVLSSIIKSTQSYKDLVTERERFVPEKIEMELLKKKDKLQNDLKNNDTLNDFERSILEVDIQVIEKNITSLSDFCERQKEV